MAATYLDALPGHGRFGYSAITARPGYRWPGGAGLAVYVALNHEHFAFGEGLGAALGPASPQPDVLKYSWREYGNRVGAWRCLELFDELGWPATALINTALYDHCPELVAACVARGDELVGHGHSNSERQGTLAEADERALLALCYERIAKRSGQAPAGWLSPWISESLRIGISNGLVCEKPGKPDSALGGQPMPAWMAWNWRLGRCLVWIRPALTARLALVGP